MQGLLQPPPDNETKHTAALFTITHTPIETFTGDIWDNFTLAPLCEEDLKASQRKKTNPTLWDEFKRNLWGQFNISGVKC